MAASKNDSKTEAAAAGQTYKVKVGDTLVFDAGETIFVYTVGEPTEKRGRLSLREDQRINKAAVSDLIG